jgi:hypothetical protein
LIRPTKPLWACLVILLSIGLVIGFSFAPYHVLGKLVFTVDVYSEVAQASYVNATFSFDKLFPIEEGQVSIAPMKSLEVPNPNGTLQMQLNMTLTKAGTSLKAPTKTIAFSREGEYLIMVPYSFDNLQAGTYQLTIRYSDWFNQTRAFWTTHELELRVS